MAVSGRKISDFKDSLSLGSAEDFEHSCVPCLSDGQHIEAQGFCVDCQEYLCKNCLHCHKKTKASKHHQLLDNDKVKQTSTASKTSNICTEKCSTHRNEVIKFFCPKHEDLGCTDCMTMNHRTCDLDYIPDKCENIEVSEEYKTILAELDQKLKEADGVMKKAADRNKNIDRWYDDVIKDTKKFRQEINDHLDTIQWKIKDEADKRRSKEKQEVKNILDSCTDFASSITKLKSSLNDKRDENKTGDLFIALKRAKSVLCMDETTRAETLLEEKTKLLFECNKTLEHILSVDSFGKLTDHLSSSSADSTKQHGAVATAAPQRKAHLSSLTHKTEINIATETDYYRLCNISGCSYLPSNKLLLADNKNKKLKVINTESKTVVDERELDSYPYDVAVLPGNQAAVTFPDKNEIMFMKATGNFSAFHTIKAQGCRGITYHQGQLYVVCAQPNSVLISDEKGNLKRTIPLKDKLAFITPDYIAVSREGTLFYISDSVNNSIVSVTPEGEMYAEHKNISEPGGLAVLDDGSLLVCCHNFNCIYHLQADFKQSSKVLSGLYTAKSVCVSPENREVYVGAQYLTNLKILNIQ